MTDPGPWPARPQREVSDLGERVAHLAATTLLANVQREKLLPLAPVFETAHYAAGETIAHQDEVDTSLRVLIEGTVSLQRERPDGALEHAGLLGYGACLGLEGVFAGQPRQTSALAVEPVSVIYLDGEVLWELLRVDADMLDRLVLPDAIRRQLRVPSAHEAAGGEVTVAVFRRHWLSVAPRLILVPGLLFGLVALLVIPLSRMMASPTSMLALALLAIAAALGSGIWIFLDWWRDYLAVTNRRVLHVEETPLIDARRAAARLERIQDARFVQPGILSRIFDYGDFDIQTAGSRTTVHFTMLARPVEARRVIFEQVKLAKGLAESERQAMIARKILAAMGQAPMQAPDTGLQAASAPEARPLPLHVLRELFDYLIPRPRIEAPDGSVTWRKHWWMLLERSWLPAMLLAFLLTTVAWIVLGFSPLSRSALQGAWLGIGLASLVLGLWLWWLFEDWRNDLYILTDELIIDIERKPLGFFSDQRQAPLSQVQDVRFVIPNPLAAILNFGHVYIETAAEKGGFTFDFVYHPEAVQEEIFFRMEQRLAAAQRAEQDRRDDELIRWIGAYHRAVGFDPESPDTVKRMAEWEARNPPPGAATTPEP
ncbi:MAG: cyclic nucleotide-binding domain-containing protein [Chloroflexi bacterium]|nr:cyclic nucleotide-binding domain-containing protein [Chloroflexota bacterium]